MNRVSTDLLDKLREAASRIEPFEHAQAVPCRTVIDEVLGSGAEVMIGGRRVLMLGSNNYFGLTFHPDVIAAAGDALVRFGTGTTGSRLANGTLALHVDLEADFARTFGKSEAIVFTTGYQANLSIIGALCGSDDFILLDAESHASIWDGARLAGSFVTPFRHNSAEHLERKLARLPGPGGNRLVVVEGLYSMSADVAPIGPILDVCRRHGAYLLVDEAHSFGVFGDRGLGCCEDQGVLEHVDFIAGTFSKALGSVGGFCVSDHPELRGVPFLGRSYVFTASGTPATIAGTRAALRVLSGDTTRRPQLWSNVRRLRSGLKALGFEIGEPETPVVPIRTGNLDLTVRIWQELIEAGVYVNIVVPPACPAGQGLLRASCTALHSHEDIDRALACFEAVGLRVGAVSSASESRA